MGAISPVLVVVALVAVLAGLEVSVAAVAGVAGGVRAVADHLSPAAAPVASHGTVTVTAEIQTGAMDGRPGWPRLAPADLTFHAGQTVVLRIVSHDDGVAPLLGAQTEFGSVQGTVGGTELVDGKPLRSMPPEDVAHTFTVVALGLNLPIPAAPTGGSVTVVARFVPTRTGTFLWQCYAPCGSGAGSVGGAMSTNGWMAGKVRVIA